MKETLICLAIALIVGLLMSRLAKSLHMRIVAEGVEKENQVAFLAKQGCDMIQGYYYAKPMPAAEFEMTRMTDTGTDSSDNR